MKYYHDEKNAKSYVTMCEGYNAAGQLGMLYEALSSASTVLELGSGPGNDLELLASRYEVTGSDYSPSFIDILKTRFPSQTVLTLDAVTIETNKEFDAIYSNKVLHHLSDDELALSFRRQGELLKPKGIVFHLVWRRLEVPEEDTGLIFKARDVDAMESAMGSGFKVLDTLLFEEFEDGDSLAILAQKK